MDIPEAATQSEEILSKYQNKLLAISELLLVYASMIGLMGITELIPGFETWQSAYLEDAILSALFYMALPGVLLFYLHGSLNAAKIFGGDSIRKALLIGGKSLSVLIPATFAFPISQWLGLDYMDWAGAAIIAGFYLAATVAVLWILRKEATIEAEVFSKNDAIVAGWIFAGGLALVAGLHQINSIARDVIIALIFIGFMEELFFRGYMQPRLNLAFGKPFEILNLRFGWGIILASVLFGLTHVISLGDLLQWSWGFWTFVSGLGFGVIREKGGSFLAPALVHGVTMIFPIVFS